VVTPVRTARSNIVYLGPSPDVKDLHCERVRIGEIRSIWWLTPAERKAIAAGANVALSILTEPIPPVRLEVVDEQGEGEDAPAVLTRLEVLRETGDVPPPSRQGPITSDPDTIREWQRDYRPGPTGAEP
jgi:hypothetical protein